MTERKPYVRPMQGWWLKHPFYIKYMIREATAVVVGIYAVVLLVGLLRLASGEMAWNAWLAAMQTPVAIIFQIIALAAALYHTITWFAVAPKVAPILFFGKQRISQQAITIAHYVLAVILYLALYIMVSI